MREMSRGCDHQGSQFPAQCCQFSDFVARFSDFSDPPNDFFSKKVTSDKSSDFLDKLKV